MIDLSHDTAVWLSKTVGLFYLMVFFLIAAVYAYWPSKRETFERAGRSILDDEEGPLPPRDLPGDAPWR